MRDNLFHSLAFYNKSFPGPQEKGEDSKLTPPVRLAWRSMLLGNFSHLLIKQQPQKTLKAMRMDVVDSQRVMFHLWLEN